MILDIPPHIEKMIIATAQAQGITAEELALATLQSRFDPNEQAYYDWFYEHHFDVEKLDKSIKSGSTPIPDWALKDLASFDKWLASV